MTLTRPGLPARIENVDQLEDVLTTPDPALINGLGRLRSEWHSPAQAVRISTSWDVRFLALISSIASGWCTSCSTAAFIADSLV